MPKFKKKRQKQGVLYIRNIDPNLKAQFKSAASLRGDTLQDVIQSLIRAYIDNPGSYKVVRQVNNATEGWDYGGD